MNGREVLETLLAGLGDSKSGELTLRRGWFVDWPQGVLNALLALKVLTPTKPAQSLDCDGCEMNCPMPVHVLSGEEGRPARAFISCDKPVNVGRVPVPLENLNQWKFTGFAFASALCRALEIATVPKSEGEGPEAIWNLGMARGSLHRAEIKLSLARPPSFEIGDHQKPVVSLLSLTNNGFELDREEVNWLLDHPQDSSQARGYKPTTAKRDSRKLDSERMYADWRKIAKAYQAKHPNASVRETALHISRQPLAKGRNLETIRRHIQKVG